MIARLASGMCGSPSRLRLVIALLLALAGGGFGIYVISHAVRATSHARAAEAFLEQSEHRQWRINLTHARDELTHCRRMSPDNARFHFLAARTARRLDDNDEAERLLDRAAQLGWVKEAIDLERALAQAQRGDLRPIEGVLVSFVARDHPEKARILEALSRGYLATYRLHRALACLDSWLEFQPDNTQARLWRGQARLLLDRATTRWRIIAASSKWIAKTTRAVASWPNCCCLRTRPIKRSPTSSAGSNVSRTIWKRCSDWHSAKRSWGRRTKR
jgi:tetratricopeptide (TPR) repeat protein